MARICFVELPVGDVAEARAFYEAAFGWSVASFGPSYASTMSGDVDLGLQGDASEATVAPLAVIQVEDLAAAQAAVAAAGGTISREAFAFPGGRRFQFRDPAGNELAVLVAE